MVQIFRSRSRVQGSEVQGFTSDIMHNMAQDFDSEQPRGTFVFFGMQNGLAPKSGMSFMWRWIGKA
jgi:hypothetical protein